MVSNGTKFRLFICVIVILGVLLSKRENRSVAFRQTSTIHVSTTISLHCLHMTHPELNLSRNITKRVTPPNMILVCLVLTLYESEQNY